MTTTFFWKPNTPNGYLSQWHVAPFDVDEVTYTTCEQYMMAEKARLFKDEATLERILRPGATPRAIKALGRRVRPFDAAQWDAKKRAIVYRGNLAKFSQNEALRDALLSTNGAVLAEASPYDKIWGIGLKESSPRAQTPTRWPGKNYLGRALMKVRRTLLAEGKT